MIGALVDKLMFGNAIKMYHLFGSACVTTSIFLISFDGYTLSDFRSMSRLTLLTVILYCITLPFLVVLLAIIVKTAIFNHKVKSDDFVMGFTFLISLYY